MEFQSQFYPISGSKKPLISFHQKSEKYLNFKKQIGYILDCNNSPQAFSHAKIPKEMNIKHTINSLLITPPCRDLKEKNMKPLSFYSEKKRLKTKPKKLKDLSLFETLALRQVSNHFPTRGVLRMKKIEKKKTERKLLENLSPLYKEKKYHSVSPFNMGKAQLYYKKSAKHTRNKFNLFYKTALEAIVIQSKSPEICI